MKDINVTMLLIALGLSFLALPLGCPSKLMFKEPLNNVTVKVGQDAVFHCVVKDLGGHRVAWNEVESKAILAIHTHVVTSDSRVKVSHDRALEIWTLKIRNVSLEDSGSYMCQLNTNPMRSQKAYLNVVIPPTLRSREIPEESVVSEGGPAELRCMAEGIPRPDIIWTREDGGPIVIRRDSSVQKFENFIGDTLHMPRVTRWDMGNYICTAKNGVEPTPRERITLHVRFPPLVRAPDPLIRVIPGGSFSAHCQVESFPASLNYWLDPEGKTVNNHGNRIRTSQEFEPPFKTTFSLSIENVTRADFGTYHCVSNNGQSKEVKSPITVEDGTTSIIQIGNDPEKGFKELFEVVEALPDEIDVDFSVDYSDATFATEKETWKTPDVVLGNESTAATKINWLVLTFPGHALLVTFQKNFFCAIW